jgi:hypothetical protein
MSWFWGYSRMQGDPGPCPVDGTPHTACTPESVGALTIHAARPRVLDRQAATALAAAAEAARPTFTTKTYRRKVRKATP